MLGLAADFHCHWVFSVVDPVLAQIDQVINLRVIGLGWLFLALEAGVESFVLLVVGDLTESHSFDRFKVIGNFFHLEGVGRFVGVRFVVVVELHLTEIHV